MNEEWKEIVGYQGYEVSNFGRVRSFWLACGHPRLIIKPKVLKPSRLKKGYLSVALKGRRFYVHALVLSAFVGPRPIKFEACHEDRNPSNNFVGNLRWDTKINNQKDKQKHGTHGKKLSEDQATMILQMCESGLDLLEIAKKFNVSKNTVYAIKTGLRWSHLKKMG